MLILYFFKKSISRRYFSVLIVRLNFFLLYLMNLIQYIERA